VGVQAAKIVASGAKKVASGAKNVATGAKKVAPDAKNVAPDAKKIAPDVKKVAPEGGKKCENARKKRESARKEYERSRNSNFLCELCVFVGNIYSFCDSGKIEWRIIAKNIDVCKVSRKVIFSLQVLKNLSFPKLPSPCTFFFFAILPKIHKCKTKLSLVRQLDNNFLELVNLDENSFQNFVSATKNF
jgi:X-X-X-Leu-X-X-Gly heptad repeat protein